ncbi:TPA: hypothetical protein ACX3E3_004907 [Vibrio parahaemolyticus]
MNAIGTADKSSRFVFGMDVNYDPSIDIDLLLEAEDYQQDRSLKDYNRLYARLWVPYEQSIGKQLAKDVKDERECLIKQFSNTYLLLSEISLGCFIE